MRRLLLITNPYATKVSPELRRRALETLGSAYDVQAADTAHPRHAIELARQAAADGLDGVVAFGGDGTVNEAANGLVDAPKTALACLPGGQANIFAKLLAMPADTVEACERLVALADQWRPRSVDLGVVNGRAFTFASGLGLDASVTRAVDANPTYKARFGPWYYSWVLARTLVRRYLLDPPRMQVSVTGPGAAAPARALSGVTTVIQNGPTFTFFKDRPIAIADGGELDSGTLAGCVLGRINPFDLPSLSLRALRSRARVSAHRHVSGFSVVGDLTVTSADDRPLPLHVDGDYLGDVDCARYTVMPGALSVLA